MPVWGVFRLQTGRDVLLALFRDCEDAQDYVAALRRGHRDGLYCVRLYSPESNAGRIFHAETV
jgi:hypothetical protein